MTTDDDVPKVRYWMGKRIDALTREELLVVVNDCYDEIASLRIERDRWRRATDPVKYLKEKPA